jgi:DinB superfamily
MENTTQQLSIKMVLDAWNTQIKNADKLLQELSDEQLLKEVAPGRNRGIYLLGHLTAVHDNMLKLLNFGDSKFPHLLEPFIYKADKVVAELPSIVELRNCWTQVNAELTKQFAALAPAGWFEKHTSVSTEDFAKEPHRNKLNIIINRTGHLAYHLGQLAFLKAAKEV